MRQEKPKTRYVSYLLRLWETSDGEHAIWRASLECPGTGERHGFADIEALLAYLRQQTADEPHEIPADNQMEC